MQRLSILLFIVCLWGLIGACTEKEPPPAPPKIIRPVKVMTLSSNVSSMEAKVFSGVAQGMRS